MLRKINLIEKIKVEWTFCSNQSSLLSWLCIYEHITSWQIDSKFTIHIAHLLMHFLEPITDPSTLNIFATRSNPKKKRKSRTAFSNQQIFELEKRFLYQKYLSPADRDEIAAGLGLSNAQVSIKMIQVLIVLVRRSIVQILICIHRSSPGSKIDELNSNATWRSWKRTCRAWNNCQRTKAF